MPVIIVAAATFVSTLLGGLFALRLKDKLHLILGFSAGTVIGVAFFDLMPEALNLVGKAYAVSETIALMAVGFAAYMIVDRMIFLHGHGEHSHENHASLGNFGAGTLSFHSLLDGLGIGFAFKVSPALGIIVAVAVLAHDFSDGINTVNFVLKNQGEKKKALVWLVIDAIAPVLGVIIAMFFTISAVKLGMLLALFSGFFLYIGASDLIPESHHAHPVRWTTLATLAGMVTLYAIVSLA